MSHTAHSIKTLTMRLIGTKAMNTAAPEKTALISPVWLDLYSMPEIRKLFRLSEDTEIVPHEPVPYI